MYKLVYVKNIDSDSLLLFKDLSKFKTCIILKDTFILKNVSKADYDFLIELSKKLKGKINITYEK